VRKVDREQLVEVARRLKRPGAGRREMLGALRHYAQRCSECGGRTRPDVVLYGESLPPGAMDESVLLASECDLLLVLGTTSLVYPAALIPRVAMDAGARIVEVNPQPTNLTALADLSIPYAAGEFFANYMKRMGWE
jgi:NAD-dependent deacetylase